MKKHDIIPSRENPFSRIRKVTPGDYKAKLKPDTISHLNDIFSHTLRKYNYD
ncbi:hypothetical protein [Crocosphaera sp.]|uniref:hypothetical protein n=1 Tax=Crocosphaera sp. TaxID=2729996 RepID=UPI0026061325|nr:hypothetical protein [Crocosphaera sp.]MDJ0581299.1 hypothetical protein [Crocosphaera sp.]